MSAWEKPEDVEAFLGIPAHKDAMAAFFRHKDGIGGAGYTSVWVPHRFNAMWLRCRECGAMVVDRSEAGQKCSCGTELPEAPAYS